MHCEFVAKHLIDIIFVYQNKTYVKIVVYMEYTINIKITTNSLSKTLYVGKFFLIKMKNKIKSNI